MALTTTTTTDSSGNTIELASSNIDTTYGGLLDTSSTADAAIYKTLRGNGIYQRSDLTDFDSFYIFPRMDPYKALGITKEYVFFTKPDLHIFKGYDSGTLNTEIANMPFFRDLMARGYGKTVLRDLQYSIDKSSPFVKLLSNYKVSNLDLTSIGVDDVETGSNIYGTKTFYRKASDHSDEECDFSIEFKDNKYLDCYLWFKVFDMYEQKKYQGKISPPSDDYIRNKILHDQISIFKFIVGDDDQTIIHYSAIYGCYPKTTPRDSFSDMPSDGNLRFTVQWKGTFQQDMDPMIIKHFNNIAQTSSGYSSSSTAMSLYDQDIGCVTGESAKIPQIAIESVSNSSYLAYKLHWYA